jgi:hypothetical protein
MSTIKIKRSGTSGAPSQLAGGELAYSYLPYSANSTPWTGGEKLYIGSGTEDQSGIAADVVAIGGKYYTDKLNHAPGALTANAALIVDANSKLDRLLVDNIEINDNGVSATGTNNLKLGTANNSIYKIDAQNHQIINVTDPTANQHAATKGYVDTTISGLTSNGTFGLIFSADSGNNDTILLGQTVVFSGNTGISTKVSDNRIDIDLDDTAVTAGSYGDATNIPTFTVDAQGRLTNANTVSISTSLSIAANTGTDSVSLLTGTLKVKGNTGIKTSVANDEILISTDDTGTASFNKVIAPTVQTTNITATANVAEVSLFTDHGAIKIGKSDGTGTTTINNDLEIGGNTLIIGDLTVQGNSVQISTSTLAVDDNIIFLNANSDSTSPDLGFVGTYNLDPANTANASQAGFYYDASTGRFKVFDGYDTSLTIGAFVDDTDPSYGFADIQAANFYGNLTGNVSGNATSASKLDHSVTINLGGDIAGNTSVDFSSNTVTINAYVQPNSVALGTDTTGDYVKVLRTTSGLLANNQIISDPINITRDQSEGGTYTISVDRASTSNTSPGVASFDGEDFSVTAGGHVSLNVVDGGTY